MTFLPFTRSLANICTTSNQFGLRPEVTANGALKFPIRTSVRCSCKRLIEKNNDLETPTRVQGDVTDVTPPPVFKKQGRV